MIAELLNISKQEALLLSILGVFWINEHKLRGFPAEIINLHKELQNNSPRAFYELACSYIYENQYFEN